MKKIRELFAILAIVATGVAMTGCGSDDDGGGGGGGGAAAPATMAAFEAGGGVWYFTPSTGEDAGQTDSITFSSGTFSMTDDEGTETGSYTYQVDTNNPHRATLTLNESEGQAVVILDFTAENAGTYHATFTPSGGGPAETEQGTFGRTNPNPNPNPGTNDPGTNNPGTNTNTNTGGGVALAGKRLNLFNEAGGEWLQFAQDNTFTSEIGGSGIYTVSTNASGTRVFIDFNAPESFANDFYDITLVPSSETAGTYSGNLHYEDADHQSQGTYTLQ